MILSLFAIAALFSASEGPSVGCQVRADQQSIDNERTTHLSVATPFTGRAASLMSPKLVTIVAPPTPAPQPPDCWLDGDPFNTCNDPAIRDQFAPDSTTPFMTIEVELIVFREDDGSNAPATPTEMATTIQELQSDFSPWRIDFVVNWRYEDDSDYRLGVKDWTDARIEFSLQSQSRMYVYAGIPNSGGGLGLGILPWLSNHGPNKNSGAVVYNDRIQPGNHMLTHEVGHVLGLYHTNETQGADFPVNCSSPCWIGVSNQYQDWIGDLCRDTPPVSANATCTSLVDTTDACSGNYPNFGLTNFMAPGNQSGGGCGDHFTANQAARMHCWSQRVYYGWIQ